MSDDSDKTVFKPMPGGLGGRSGVGQGANDRTSARPLPGGRPTAQAYSGGSGSPFPGGSAPQQNHNLAGNPQGVVSRTQNAAPGRADANFFRNVSGLNTLVNAASSLIGVIEKTRQSMSHPDVGGLHQRLTTEIRAFDAQVRASGVKPEIALAARYVLCSALDETI